MRAYWDGGISRGRFCDTLAYANTTKDVRLTERPVATGLWSRYAKPIHAPDWFLNLLPDIPLDGELYLGRGQFQELISIVKQHQPDERWKDVQYVVFDSPSDFAMFAPGKINNPNCKMVMPSLWEEASELRSAIAPAVPFYQMLNRLNSFVTVGANLTIADQTRLPNNTPRALEKIKGLLDFYTDYGGEGLMLRKPESIWEPRRSQELLKVKKFLDSEGVVLGYTWGKGKLEGLMGSMTIKWRDKVFELSGFTDEERSMIGMTLVCEPGTIVSNSTYNPKFPRGSTITFRYSEVSKDGIPLKARYYRVPEMR
jgi:DNA ligase-1